MGKKLHVLKKSLPKQFSLKWPQFSLNIFEDYLRFSSIFPHFLQTTSKCFAAFAFLLNRKEIKIVIYLMLLGGLSGIFVINTWKSNEYIKMDSNSFSFLINFLLWVNKEAFLGCGRRIESIKDFKDSIGFYLIQISLKENF